MVRSAVRKQVLLSSLKKQTISPPGSLKKQSNSLKKQSNSLKKQNSSRPSSSIALKEDMIKKEHEEEDDINEYVTGGSNRKRKLGFGKSELRQMVKRSKSSNYPTHLSTTTKRSEQSYASRWSTTRYEQAEENMLKIMQSEGAVFGNPISRTSLRAAARKYIGDTGLLDHLLKHMDGKVAPGGSERFRRWHNSNGQMEYWLESSYLFDIRKEAGIKDPFWMPPPGWKPGCSPSDSSGFAVELKILREEMDKMKRDFQALVAKKAEEDLANNTPSSSVSNQGVNSDSCLAPMQSELENWKQKIKKQLYDISCSLGSVQDTFVNLENWKSKIEQKLLDISISASPMQTSRRSNTFTPLVPDNWDFFSNPDLVNTQSDDFASWLGGSELIDLQQPDYDNVPWVEGLDFVKIDADTTPVDLGPSSAVASNPDQSLYKDHIDYSDLEIVKEEMSNMKRNLKDALLKEDDDGSVNIMSDSSATVNSKLDLENSILILQELYKDVVKMKADIERRVKEISVSPHGSEVPRQDTG